MNRLLRIEWNKMFYNKGTRIFLILYFALIGLMGIILPNIKPNINGMEIDFIKLGALNFPVIWHNITWLISFGKFFLAIIIINNITNEYSFGTFKQNTIDGLTKKEFLGTKLLMNLIFALFSTLLVAIIVISLGATFAENFDFIKGIEFLLGYFVEICTYISFAVFLSFLLRKSTFAILLLFIWKIIEWIIIGIEYFTKNKLNPSPEESTTFTTYLPLSANSNIIGFPPGSISQYLMGGKFFQDSSVSWDYLTINVIYTILFLGLSYLIVKKRDL
ncbi:ABC transporter permease subunit [Faecalibacter rhinopitheci]|uniref:ABC transporter permease subunit n=1 Tax=Faecalibacter rhinopitheci TaxID=2779678 RepID=A0A8J7FQZ2_9FLAO|nr:ABC transporter permease subunit [Faecalibacter rhinopitheci]MBF0596082.1 ABC transporter permease subunit [Faecalibacter rhinopitheci]